MKKHLFIIILLFVFTSINAQLVFLPAMQDGKWGVINEKAQTIVPCEYNEVEIIDSKYIIVRRNDFYGLYDFNSKFVLDTIFTEIKITKSGYLIKQDSLFGLYDFNANVLLDIEYSEINNTEAGYLIKKDSLYGLFDFNSKFILDIEYSNIKYTESGYLVKKDSLYGLFNSKGNILLEIEYSKINKSSSGKYILEKDKQACLYYSKFDFKTELCKNFYYRKINNYLLVYKQEDGLFTFNSFANSSQKFNFDSISYIQKRNNTNRQSNMADFLVSKYDFVYYYSFKNNKKGVLNDNLKTLIPPIFDEISYSPGLFSTRKNFLYGLYDTTGNKIFDAKYTLISKTNYNTFLIYEGQKTGVASNTGQVIVKPEYMRIRHLTEDYLIVERANNKKGMISILGNKVKNIISRQYADISTTTNQNLFYVTSFSKYCNGKIITPASSTEDKKKSDYKWGLYNTSGEMVLDTLYNKYKIQIFEDQVRIEKDTSCIVITFDENGKIIDKLELFNFISYNVKEQTGENVWRQIKKSDGVSKVYKWGLFSPTGKRLIDFKFRFCNSNFMNNPDLVRTINGSYNGIVNQKTGKELLECFYIEIRLSDFNNANVARCFTRPYQCCIINRDGERITNFSYSYVDDFDTTHQNMQKRKTYRKRNK